jgi:hypothetical protein
MLKMEEHLLPMKSLKRLRNGEEEDRYEKYNFAR